jgi:hypothetical protein
LLHSLPLFRLLNSAAGPLFSTHNAFSWDSEKPVVVLVGGHCVASERNFLAFLFFLISPSDDDDCCVCLFSCVSVCKVILLFFRGETTVQRYFIRTSTSLLRTHTHTRWPHVSLCLFATKSFVNQIDTFDCVCVWLDYPSVPSQCWFSGLT